MLTDSERQRYARHLTLPQFGEEGQERLKKSSALIVGAGGLGSPVLMYLAAAGVGRIGIVDFDRVDFTNLHRQVLYGMSDLDRPKIEAAADRLRDINSLTEIEPYETALSSENAMKILADYDVVIDGTDNFPTRYLVNDACVFLGKPNVYGSIFRFEGQASVFDATKGPCYRCLYPEPPPPNLVPSCAEGGVLGVLPGVIGTIQATEAIKLLAKIGEPLIGRLLLFDALEMSVRQLKLKKNVDCVVCGTHPTVTELIDYEGFCNPPMSDELTPAEVPAGALLIDVREPHEWAGGHIEGARHIPMRTIPQQLDSIPRDRDVVIYCQHGQRSAQVLDFMRAQGFTRARHLKGGYVAWLRSVGPVL